MTSRLAAHLAACVTETTLSLTEMRPVRSTAPSWGATENDTGLSPNCGMEVVTVIQELSDCALHMHAFCVGPPHV